MTIAKEAVETKKKQPSLDDFIVPPEFKNDSVSQALSGLLTLANVVMDASEVATRKSARETFDNQVDQVLDSDSAVSRFLSSEHPFYEVTWMGYMRYLYGSTLGGKERLDPRIQPRGVGSKSGR